MPASIEEVKDDDEFNQHKQEGEEDPSDGEDNNEMMAAAEPGSSSTTSKGKKNKKKKKSKTGKADSVPQEVVNLVMNEVQCVILFISCLLLFELVDLTNIDWTERSMDPQKPRS